MFVVHGVELSVHCSLFAFVVGCLLVVVRWSQLLANVCCMSLEVGYVAFVVCWLLLLHLC